MPTVWKIKYNGLLMDVYDENLDKIDINHSDEVKKDLQFFNTYFQNDPMPQFMAAEAVVAGHNIRNGFWKGYKNKQNVLDAVKINSLTDDDLYPKDTVWKVKYSETDRTPEKDDKVVVWKSFSDRWKARHHFLREHSWCVIWSFVPERKIKRISKK